MFRIVLIGRSWVICNFLIASLILFLLEGLKPNENVLNLSLLNANWWLSLHTKYATYLCTWYSRLMLVCLDPSW